FDTARCSWLASVGIRYAHIAQGYNAAVVNANGSLGATILSGNNFNGAGPTAALETRRRLGTTGLFLYAKARGSVLFGTARKSAVEKPFAAAEAEEAQSRTHSTIPEGELEFGAGFQRATGIGNLFVKFGLVGQGWITAGNASDSSGSGFLG